MPRTISVAAIQTSYGEDMQANIAKTVDFVREAAGRGAQVILPSELFQGPYFCVSQEEHWFGQAFEWREHPCVTQLTPVARELGVAIPVSIFERDGPQYYNSLVMLDADGEALAKSPPPALYSCRVYDNSTYWREDDAPPARCRPLQTVGIGGVPGMGAGEACERHEDVCTAVPADDLCRAWDARVREAEFRWRFGDSGTRESAGVEYERLFKQLQASACAT